MKKFIIIASKLNVYTGQVQKLKQESILQAEIIYIEDLNDEDLNLWNFKDSIIYFVCCNSLLVSETIKKIEKHASYIINKDYLLNNYKKLEVQKHLIKNGIKTPQIYDFDEIENIKFPIFCKENNHEGIIVQVFNKITLKKLFNKFDYKNFYIEDSIENNNEIKIYYVNGKVFLRNGESYDNIINETCKKVSLALNNLEVFSADIIQNKGNERFVIDVNPSAGFYLSDDGRKFFLNELSKK